jgi:AbrB family looped-hinge helix DNA binding protein
MKTSIDRLGRVVVPKPIRDRLHLKGGEVLEVEERDGVVELRPAPIEMRTGRLPKGRPSQWPTLLLSPTTSYGRRENVRR